MFESTFEKYLIQLSVELIQLDIVYDSLNYVSVSLFIHFLSLFYNFIKGSKEKLKKEEIKAMSSVCNSRYSGTLGCAVYSSQVPEVARAATENSSIECALPINYK